MMIPLASLTVGGGFGLLAIWVAYELLMWRRRRRRALAVGVARLQATIAEAKRRRAAFDHSWRGDEQRRQLKQVLQDGSRTEDRHEDGGG